MQSKGTMCTVCAAGIVHVRTLSFTTEFGGRRTGSAAADILPILWETAENHWNRTILHEYGVRK